MVPFPHDRHERGARGSASFAAQVLRRIPDGKGLILPPVKKETVEGPSSIWTKIAAPADLDYAFPGNSTHYGLFRYYIRTWGILKHRLRLGAVDNIVDRALQHNTYKERTEDGGMKFWEWKDVNINRAVEDAKKVLFTEYPFTKLPEDKRRQMARELEVLIPVAAEVAGLIGDHGEKVARYWKRERPDKYKDSTTAEVFMSRIEMEGDPRLEIWQSYGPEAIKKIHKLHRLIYELTKPISRVVFEKPSGVEEFWTSTRRRRWRERYRSC